MQTGGTFMLHVQNIILNNNNKREGKNRGDSQLKPYTFQNTYLLGGQCKIALDRVRLSISQDHRSIYLRLWSVGNCGSLWRRLQQEKVWIIV